MPALSVRFIRAALIYLALGFTLGAVLLSNEALAFYPPVQKLLPSHMEMLLMGWFIQLALGVAYWILPRLPGARPRGNENMVWLAFWLINSGIVLVILASFTSITWLLPIGRLAELAGVVAFVAGVWGRVKSFSSLK